MSKIENMARLLNRLSEMGFSYTEAKQLRRIEMTLHRWAERECNGEVERDEQTNKTYSVYQSMSGQDKRYPTADRESGALKRLARIMSSHPGFVAYHQTDPRGCALYIVDKSSLNGSPIEQVYNRGLAVCV